MSKDVLNFYTAYFLNWDSKNIGPKPTAKDLDTIARLGAKHGKQVFANAMAMRKDGVTGSEIVIACGAPQLNKMRGFVTDGLLKRELVPQRNGHTVYKLTLTPKGAAKIKGTAIAAKPKKVVKKAVKPTVQTPQEAPQISA